MSEKIPKYPLDFKEFKRVNKQSEYYNSKEIKQIHKIFSLEQGDIIEVESYDEFEDNHTTVYFIVAFFLVYDDIVQISGKNFKTLIESDSFDITLGINKFDEYLEINLIEGWIGKEDNEIQSWMIVSANKKVISKDIPKWLDLLTNSDIPLMLPNTILYEGSMCSPSPIFPITPLEIYEWYKVKLEDIKGDPECYVEVNETINIFVDCKWLSERKSYLLEKVKISLKLLSISRFIFL